MWCVAFEKNVNIIFGISCSSLFNLSINVSVTNTFLVLKDKVALFYELFFEKVVLIVLTILAETN
jgi:hypothetical protein